MNSKLIDKCNRINSSFDLMKEKSNFVSGDVFYSFLSSNRPLKHRSVPYESAVLGNEVMRLGIDLILS